MKTIHLIFGVHWHAPLGYSDHDFEAVYQDTYKHFLSTLYEIERLPVVLHYSGIVLEFLEKNHPEYLNLLDEMMKRKQVELIGGGFYDPILPLVPLLDKIGQIELCTTYLRSHFGKRPRGLWLPEQVWEATLPNTLKSCGIEYTFLNESAFLSVRRSDDDLFYPHLTEEHGKNITIFPLTLRLKDLLFRKSPREVIRFLRRQASEDGERVISILIDGECYTKRFVLPKGRKNINWLKEFHARLNDHRDTIIPVVPQEYLKGRNVTRKIYFSGTYSDAVSRAALRPPYRRIKTRRPIAPAASNFKQIFNKYRESNLLYAKMMYTHLTVHQMRGDKSRKKSALEELWRGQCHYGYWHGRHLGIYDNALRKEIYKSFITAEKYTRVKGSFLSSIITADFDFDGEPEILYQSNEMNVYIHRQNGMIFELDYIPVCWNYGDTLSRIREYYHRDGTDSFDGYPRKIFVEHFFHFKKDGGASTLSDRIADVCACPGAEYQLKELKREQRQMAFFYGGCLDGRREKTLVELEKRYSFRKNTVVTDYVIRNTGEKKFAVEFGTEINLALLSALKENLKLFDSSKKTPGEIDAAAGERANVRKITVEDKLNNVLLELTSAKPCSLFNHSVYSHARENGKIRRQFQALCLFPSWGISLEPNEIWEMTLELSIQKM
ncbi:MAG: DUF1926 domain-containing protein [Spirochaetales bacterium]|nr:DUF1926 domain-containing protein [Spirochaetales bacterium]